MTALGADRVALASEPEREAEPGAEKVTVMLSNGASSLSVTRTTRGEAKLSCTKCQLGAAVAVSVTPVL